MTVFLTLGMLAIGFVLVHPVAERARFDDYVRHATPAFTVGEPTTLKVIAGKWRRVDHLKAVPNE